MYKKAKPRSSNQEWFFEDYQQNTFIEIGPVYVEKDELIEFALRYDPQPMHKDYESAKKGIEVVVGKLIKTEKTDAVLETRKGRKAACTG